MGNFHFVLVRIVIDYASLLNLKSFVVDFDFVKRTSFEYLFYLFFMFCEINSM